MKRKSVDSEKEIVVLKAKFAEKEIEVEEQVNKRLKQSNDLVKEIENALQSVFYKVDADIVVEAMLNLTSIIVIGTYFEESDIGKAEFLKTHKKIDNKIDRKFRRNSDTKYIATEILKAITLANSCNGYMVVEQTIKKVLQNWTDNQSSESEN